MKQPMPMASVWNLVSQRIFVSGQLFDTEKAQTETYDVRVARVLWTFANLYGELWRLQRMLTTADDLQHIRVILKLYVTSWVTLSDVLANVINEVFELGYAAQDVELTAILRNRHVAETQIPAVIRKHRAALDHAGYARMRNDIVHRGRLEERDLDLLESEWLQLQFIEMSSAISKELEKQAGGTRSTAANIASTPGENDWLARVHALRTARAARLEEHLDVTSMLFHDIGAILERVIKTRPAA